MHNQSFGQPTGNAPIFSPFNYQQPTAQPLAAPQQQYVNQNFYNPGFTDNMNNNQAKMNHQTTVQQTASMAPPPHPSVQSSFQHSNHQEGDARTGHAPPMGNFQRTQRAFMPSPSTSPMQLPPPPQTETIADEQYTSNQQMNLPAPPPVQTYDPSTLSRPAPEQNSFNQDWSQQQTWPQQTATPENFVTTTPSWQPPPPAFHQATTTVQTQVGHNPFAQPQNPRQAIPAQAAASVLDSFSSHSAFGGFNEPQQQPDAFNYGTSARFFDNVETSHNLASENAGQQPPQASSSSPGLPKSHVAPQNFALPPQLNQQQHENLEHFQVEQPRSYVPQNADNFHPENRERLDDVASPQSSSFTDRHNYLVTGQLSQERTSQPHQSAPNQLVENRNLPPPGLSRMVVGQPESNQEQVTAADVPPPGLNRMVTGNEMTPSYMNYQRQADGEVSQPPIAVLPRPQSNSPFTGHHQSGPEVMPPSFNTSDRNLYLVAGESDLNDQRVVPGVESDVANVLNTMQNLHIEDDDDFVNVSVPTQERNVNVDGMETPEQDHNRSIDNQPREEAIDGANDNTEVPVVATVEHDYVEPESDLREEAIEGANDEAGKPAAPYEKLKSDKKHKHELTMSSEDSELRALSKQKPKSRRNKKYADDSNESENDFSDNDKRDKYRRVPREKMSREDYERSRRKEKERRSGDRPRKGDDTDGSKYGDSRKRTDDDEDDYRKTRDKFKKSLRRNQEGDEVDDKDRKKRSDKYRDSGSRRSKLIALKCNFL